MKLTATVVTLIVVAGVVILTDNLKPKATTIASHLTPSVSTSTTSSTPTTTNSTSSSSTGSFKDGIYSATADYFVPNSDQRIKVTVTLSKGVITSSSVQNSESDPTSASYQEEFASMYKSSVVGQKLSGLQIGAIAGASDTTQGFDDALSQIASQAQA